jgi:hypothetical protein
MVEEIHNKILIQYQGLNQWGKCRDLQPCQYFFN